MDVRTPFFQNIACVLIGVLFLNPIVTTAAELALDAQSGSNAAVTQAANGVPMVNIATPNGSGLSHNKFTDFNVSQQGLILNNSAQAVVQTQLGGYVMGNPNLTGGAANIILNEVNGGSPSQLKGYTEVAGKSAAVIVANPHGISCDGCGFINTPRVTLSTGKPVLEGGRLDRFDVEGGQISIEGDGLNARNVSQFDLITRSAQINAELHANQLNVITGRNDVDAANLTTTAKADDGSAKPQLAIDSSALGGMYAGAIRLVGTEAGVGVKLAGDMAASAGDIQIDANGQLSMARTAASRDLQLKGAGPTPYSRNGDGRAAIGPVLREYLVSEAMHALGVPTTRALAAVATGEAVFREGAVPGAVLTRVAASHVRVGTFQFFAAREDHAAVRQLVDFVIARHYPALAGHANPPLAMFEAVVKAQARLVSAWLQVGFVHGVMNTDNMAVSGETIDYGPCAFLDEYHPAKTFSSIDRNGRYAYGNQPGIAQWNLARLAECLLPLIDADGERAVALARAAIEGFAPAYRAHWLAGQRRKLGLATEEEGDEALAQDFLEALQAVGADYTVSYRALSQAARGEPGGLPKSPGMDAWLARWRERLARDSLSVDARVAALDAGNPAVIPRNHLVEAALSAAAAGELAPFNALLAAVRRPCDDGPDQAPFMQPPDPAERVTRTFCGT